MINLSDRLNVASNNLDFRYSKADGSPWESVEEFLSAMDDECIDINVANITILVKQVDNSVAEMWNPDPNSPLSFVKKDSSVVNNLTSNETTKALSANQGRILSSYIGNLANLETNTHTNLVAVINELVARIAILENYHGSDIPVYSITKNLTGVLSSNSNITAYQGSSFQTTLSLITGYENMSVVITMNGVDITSSAYSAGTITINNVTGNIVITAVANFIESNIYRVSQNLTGVLSSNSVDNVSEGESFMTTLTLLDGYENLSVTITMGGENITSTAYNESTKVVLISNVTENIIISAVATRISPVETTYLYAGGCATWDDTMAISAFNEVKSQASTNKTFTFTIDGYNIVGIVYPTTMTIKSAESGELNEDIKNTLNINTTVITYKGKSMKLSQIKYLSGLLSNQSFTIVFN